MIMLQVCKYKKNRCFKVTVAAYLVLLFIMMLWWRSHDRIALSIKQYYSEETAVKTELRINRLPVSRSIHSSYFKTYGNDIQNVLRQEFSPERRFCNSQFVTYRNLFATLRNVIINPYYGHGKKGGENISSVLNQPERDEYYELDNGYFNVDCPVNRTVRYIFDTGHLTNWIEALTNSKPEVLPTKVVRDWTIAVQRYEYANLYHTMTDFYNAFLLMHYLKMSPSKINILWIDGHPQGALDKTWKVLFGETLRAGDLREAVLFKNMAWNIIGYSSLLNNHILPKIPLLEEFRLFFMSSFGIQDSHKLNCDNIRVVFLWRRDYLAHPRNPSGLVSRKVKNEDELIEIVRWILPGHSVRGVQIDIYNMAEQLAIIATTDILIGMHGAGLTHTLFLPRSSGLIELYPTYWPTSNRHFRAMAQWRNLHYLTWQNTDPSKELPEQYTLVDPESVRNMVHEMHHSLCGKKVHEDK